MNYANHNPEDVPFRKPCLKNIAGAPVQLARITKDILFDQGMIPPDQISKSILATAGEANQNHHRQIGKLWKPHHSSDSGSWVTKVANKPVLQCVYGPARKDMRQKEIKMFPGNSC